MRWLNLGKSCDSSANVPTAVQPSHCSIFTNGQEDPAIAEDKSTTRWL
jgi:hypothetical protein